jgi:hypothetical protein
MAKYDPLHGHLRRQKTQTYEMTFPDVERIIASMLPKSAQRSEWWANETAPLSRHVQCRAWLDAGYNAFLVKGAERVRFERR